MKKSKRATIIVLMGIAIISTIMCIVFVSKSLNNNTADDKINANNIKEPGFHEKIGDITMRILAYEIGARIGAMYKEPNMLKEDILYLAGEETDEKGTLRNRKVYVEIQNIIRNTSDDTIEINLEEFYLVLCDAGGTITRGSTKPRYAYLKTDSDNVKLDEFNLTLNPGAETSLQITYVEDFDNLFVSSGVLKSNCYYRVKYNKDIGYYNIKTSSTLNPL